MIVSDVFPFSRFVAFVAGALVVSSLPARASSPEDVCAILAQNHVASVANSESYLHSKASQAWSQCQEMRRTANDTAALQSARSKLLSGGGSVSYGLFGADASFSSSDLASENSFKQKLLSEASRMCGTASSASELEQSMSQSGTTYFNTSPYVVECLNVLKNNPISFSVAALSSSASFTVAAGNGVSSAKNVEVLFDSKKVACSGNNGKAVGSDGFCQGRPAAERELCKANVFPIGQATPLSLSCTSKVEDEPVDVVITFNGSILQIPVPTKVSKDAKKAARDLQLANEALRSEREKSAILISAIQADLQDLKAKGAAKMLTEMVGAGAVYFDKCISQLDATPMQVPTSCMMMGSRHCTDRGHKGGYWTGGIAGSGADRKLDARCID